MKLLSWICLRKDRECHFISCLQGIRLLIPMASPNGDNHSVKLHADAKLYAGLFNGEEFATLAINTKLKAYVHLIQGSLNVNGETLTSGDALLIQDEAQIQIKDGENAEVLVFELTA